MFSQYWWPGNVRQLKNEIQRAVALSAPGGTIEPSHLSPEIGVDAALPATARRRGDRAAARRPNLASAVEQVERDLIQAALDRTGGNISETARSLGLTRRGLYLKTPPARPRRAAEVGCPLIGVRSGVRDLDTCIPQSTARRGYLVYASCRILRICAARRVDLSANVDNRLHSTNVRPSPPTAFAQSRARNLIRIPRDISQPGGSLLKHISTDHSAVQQPGREHAAATNAAP